VLALRNFIENYIAISESDWETISDCFERKEVEKNQIILNEGAICNYLYFLESGLLRYFINKDGNEITKFFTVAPYFFTSQVSFNNQKPATENIQAIEKSVVWQITFQDSNKLFELESWTIFARKITQEVQYFTEQILEEIQSETAEFRYEKMLQNQPELTHRIPLKYLASFLGIAPQSLSRVRKKLIEKDKK
jgi:CRP-like cAMP-binding protein